MQYNVISPAAALLAVYHLCIHVSNFLSLSLSPPPPSLSLRIYMYIYIYIYNINITCCSAWSSSRCSSLRSLSRARSLSAWTAMLMNVACTCCHRRERACVRERARARERVYQERESRRLNSSGSFYLALLRSHVQTLSHTRTFLTTHSCCSGLVQREVTAYKSTINKQIIKKHEKQVNKYTLR